MRERSLRNTLTWWSIGATAAAMLVFATVTYVVVELDEASEADSGVPDDPATVSEEAREEVMLALAIAAPVGIALAIFAARLAARRAMRAIDRATQTAAEISIDRFDRRMDVPPTGDELRPLALAVNSLLDRLQRGYEALAAFSASASHELRTPIAAVCNELEVQLRRPRTVEDWQATAGTVLGELRRLGDVVQAMLRFAQADAVKDADARDVDLADLVEEVAATHADLAAKSGVALAARLDANTAIVRGDASLLATAIGNLTANAVRAAGTTPSGKVTVSLASAPDAFAIHVDDTGPGVADTSQLFVPFARQRHGIGLGLAIAQRIATRHGGAIAHLARPGGGTRFTISLPRDS